MNIEELINEINGLDENAEENKAKVITTILLGETDKNGENKKELLSQSILNPEIQIRNMLDSIMIDIIFDTDMDADLKEMWKITEKYISNLDQYAKSENDDEHIPILNFIFMPKDSGGHYFAQAINPIYSCLTPIYPGKPVSCLRLLFDADNVNFYTSEDINLEDIDINADIELQKRSHLETRDELRRKERIQYMKELEDARKRNL